MSNKFDQVLQDKIDELDAQKHPDRDLWKGIELGISSSSQRQDLRESSGKFQFGIPAIAASVALVVGLTWSVSQPFFTPQVETSNPLALVEQLSSQYQDQRNALLVQYEGQTAATENWQQQLTELDEAAEVIKAALQDDPNNTALLRMLQSVYHQQLDLIERVHAPKWNQI